MDEDLQDIDDDVFIAPGVQIYGKVQIARGCSLWPNVVIRAEAQEVRIGAFSNVQDMAMIHVGYDAPTHIGAHCSITHQACIHGATIEDDCLIGIHATVMDGAVVGRGSIVAGGAVISEGKHFPAGSIIAGVPAKVIAERDSARANRLNAWQYRRNARAYQRGEHRSWDGEDYRRWLRETEVRIEKDLDLEDPPA